MKSMIANCPTCGAPCLGTYRVWFEKDGVTIGVECDQPVLEDALDGIFELGLTTPYEQWPDFVRAHNECRGCFFDPGKGTLDFQDFRNSIAMARQWRSGQASSDAHLDEVLDMLDLLNDEAHRSGCILNFIDD